MVEQSPIYVKVHNELKKKFEDQILVEKEISGPAHYYYAEHFKEVRRDMEIFKRQARSKFVLLCC